MVTEDLLTQLGVDVAGGSDREIKALCPVHHLVKGRPDTRPSWYMNRTTGAWICFSCGQRGSLSSLVQQMGGNLDDVLEARFDIAVAAVEEMRDEDDGIEEGPKQREVYISEYGFAKNPLPPKPQRATRDIKGVVCTEYNLRWHRNKGCYLIPLYSVDTLTLIGWQEKHGKRFVNVPDGVDKTDCLFGFQQYRSGDLLIVESPLDVVRLAGYGYRAVSTMGSFVSDVQVDAIRRAANKGSIILAMDNDHAGRVANEYLAQQLDDLMAPVLYFRYPHRRLGKDPGDLPAEYLEPGVTRASNINI